MMVHTARSRSPAATLATVAHRMVGFARTAWRWLRETSGDAAYERYAAFRRRTGAAPLGSAREMPLDEREFYRDRLERRYSSINRCC